jgi:cleavage and polyadenylation specificity factor subunit 2
MDYAKLSVAELKSKLNAASVPFASNAIKSKLIALLQAHDQKHLEAEKLHAASAAVALDQAVHPSSEMADGMDGIPVEFGAPVAAAADHVLDDEMLAKMQNIVDPMDASEDEDDIASQDEDDNDGVGDGDVRTRVVPLYGCETFGATCVLIAANRMNVLVDCGLDDSVDLAARQKLKQKSGRILAVLLTHPSIDHIGALPLLVGKFGCSAPIYASQPVKDFARWILYDYLESKLRVEDFKLFNREDIDNAVARIRPLSWSQDTLVLESELPLQIKAVRAGCVLGASSWRMNLNGADIVYLGRFNHDADALVDPLDVFPLLRPDVVISDAGIKQSGFKKHVLRAAGGGGASMFELREEIEACIHKKGDVVIVMESGGRGIDAMHYVSSLKKELNLKVDLYYVGSQAYRIIVCAETQMEWVKKDIVDEFSADRKNVLKLPKVNSDYTTWEELRLSGSDAPRIIFCSQNNLECGAASDIFPDLCSKEHNLFVFTGVSAPGSLLAKLCPSSSLASVVDAAVEEAPCKVIKFMKRQRVPLQGAELKVWEAERKLLKDRIHREKTTVLQIQENQSKMEEELRREEEEDADQDMHDELKPKHSRAKTSQFPRFAFFSGMDTENMKFDDFGAVVDWESVLKHANYEEERSGLVRMDSLSRAVAREEFEEIPYKYEEFETSVVVNCKVAFWDISDRADAQAVARTICDLHPCRSLFFGSKKRVEDLKKFDKDRKIPYLTVLSTSEPTTVNVGSIPTTVTISRHVAAAISLQRVKRDAGANTSSDVWISQLRAEVKERDNGIKVLEATDRGSTAVSGTFRLVFKKFRFFCCNVTSCSIGEVLLLDVKTEVEKIGLTAKFSATSRCAVPSTEELLVFFASPAFCRKYEKVLIVNGKIRVVLRSAVSKEVRVSGPVSRELQAVRKIVRRMLVQLT